MQHINSLPSLVFRVIFSRLSFHDLLSVGRVCALWKEYQLEFTLKIHSITLLVGSETLHHQTGMAFFKTPHDLIAKSSFTLPHYHELLNDQDLPLFVQQQPSPSLTLPHLSISTLNQLVESLPNVHTLNISINGIACDVLKQVIYLLNQWKDQLVTLKLWCDFRDDDKIYQHFCYSTSKSYLSNLAPKLFNSLNSFSVLEHVTLEFYYWPSTNFMHNCDFSFLFGVREFNCYLPYEGHHVSRWLLAQNSNKLAQLQRIGLAGLDERMMGEFASNQFFACKITFLPKPQNIATKDILKNTFYSLTTMRTDFEFYNLSFAAIIKLISSLKQLIHLHINFYKGCSLTEFNQVPTRWLTQLPQVKSLSIDATENHYCHTDHLESPHWGWIFPNVQILSVEHSCIVGRPYDHFDDVACDESDDDDEIIKCPNLDRFSPVSPVPLEVLIEGLRVLLATFKQCPSLRQIYLNDQLPKYNDPDVIAKFNFNL